MGLWHHRYAKLVAACTLLLIAAGGMVTSTGSGLSVPDWPTTYGWNMFTFPLSKWVGGIRYEHSHRLIASTVGMLTIGLAFWTAVWGGWGALLAVPMLSVTKTICDRVEGFRAVGELLGE